MGKESSSFIARQGACSVMIVFLSLLDITRIHSKNKAIHYTIDKPWHLL